MNINVNQREMIIANLLKCVDGLYLTDVEIIFDLARNSAFEKSKVILAPKVERTPNNAPDID